MGEGTTVLGTGLVHQTTQGNESVVTVSGDDISSPVSQPYDAR